LGGGLLASPAAASPRRAAIPTRTGRVAVHHPLRSLDRTRLTNAERRRIARISRRLGLSHRPGGVAHAADYGAQFRTNFSPNNTLSLMVDVRGASQSPGAGVIDWWANYGTNQTWIFVPDGTYNDYIIVSAGSDQCLTTDGVAGDQV